MLEEFYISAHERKPFFPPNVHDRVTTWNSGNSCYSNLFIKRYSKFAVQNVQTFNLILQNFLVCALGSWIRIIPYETKVSRDEGISNETVKFVALESVEPCIYNIYNTLNNTVYTVSMKLHRNDKMKINDLIQKRFYIHTYTYPEGIKIPLYQVEKNLDHIAKVIFESSLTPQENIERFYKEIFISSMLLKPRYFITNIPSIWKDQLSYEESQIMMKLTKMPFLGTNVNNQIHTYHSKNSLALLLSLTEIYQISPNLSRNIHFLYKYNTRFVNRLASNETIIFAFHKLRPREFTYIQELLDCCI